MTKTKDCPPRISTRNGRRSRGRMLTRLRSKTIEMKKVRFEAPETSTQLAMQMTRSAARSLFLTRSILELPNELLSMILRYCNAEELMLLRCVCQKFVSLIDNNNSIWSNVSFQNLWPATKYDQHVFARGVEAKNPECLIKLGLNHLYRYSLTAGVEKNNKEIKINASLSASYFRNLDNSIAPMKPLTWMLIRPPWSTAKSLCLKQAVHQQLLKIKTSDADRAVCYNIGRVLKLDNEDMIEKATENLKIGSEMGCKHSNYEKLMEERCLSETDKGVKLKWFRELFECANSGNLDASFELCHQIATGNSDSFIPNYQAKSLFQEIFSKCGCSRLEKLDCYQPKINSLMRCILVDWLAEVAYMKDMSHQVLHAAVQYVDRFLTARVVERAKLQLLGITCLLLAAKSHNDPRQVHILTVRESSWLTDQTYQYEDVVKMLGEIIGTLKGDLWTPSSWDYLDVLLSFPVIDSESMNLSHYLHDMSLLITAVGGYKSSTVAASILFLARIILNKGNPWPTELAEYSGFTVRDLANCAAVIYFKSFTCPSLKDDRNLPLKSIKEEYLSASHHHVAKTLIPLQTVIKDRILSTDTMLSCVSQDPLNFVEMSVDIDETLNLSVKSVDYDGDCEDYNDLVTDSSFEEESFCVGRTRLSSFHSVDDFSDDETTMDADCLHFPKDCLKFSPRESFTPIFHSVSERTNILESKMIKQEKYPLKENGIFLFPDEPGCSSVPNSNKINKDNKIVTLKRKQSSSLAADVCMAEHGKGIGKRTRSSYYSK